MKVEKEEQDENLLDNFSFELDIPTEDSEELEDRHQEESNLKVVEEDEDEDYEEDDEQEGERQESEEDSDDEDEESDEESEELSPFEEALSTLVSSGDFIVDEDGEYEDSVDGVRKFVEDNIEHKYKAKLESLSPTARKLIELEELGADIKEAFGEIQQFDYDALDLTDEDNRREVLSDYYRALDEDLTDEELEEKIQDVVDLGKDDREATKAVKFFKKKDKERVEAYEASVKQQSEEAEKNYQKELKKIQSTVMKADGFAGIKFKDSAEKEAYLSYILDRDETGKTQAEKDDENLDTILTRELYKFRKFNFKDIEKKVTTKKTVEVKKFLKQRDDTSSSGRRGEAERIKTGKAKFDLGSSMPWLE